jgi:hypothetical protein
VFVSVFELVCSSMFRLMADDLYKTMDTCVTRLALAGRAIAGHSENTGQPPACHDERVQGRSPEVRPRLHPRAVPGLSGRYIHDIAMTKWVFCTTRSGSV